MTRPSLDLCGGPLGFEGFISLLRLHYKGSFWKHQNRAVTTLFKPPRSENGFSFVVSRAGQSLSYQIGRARPTYFARG